MSEEGGGKRKLEHLPKMERRERGTSIRRKWEAEMPTKRDVCFDSVE